jgi:hypothetical protein
MRLQKLLRKRSSSDTTDSTKDGEWAVWMYKSPEVMGGLPLFLLVYEWERAGYRALYVQSTVFSSDLEEAWDGSAPGWEAFEQPYHLTKLIERGEVRRVGPLPFDDLPRPERDQATEAEADCTPVHSDHTQA